MCTQEDLLYALGYNPIQLSFLAQVLPTLSAGSSFTGCFVPLLQAHPVYVLSPVLETATYLQGSLAWGFALFCRIILETKVWGWECSLLLWAPRFQVLSAGQARKACV